MYKTRREVIDWLKSVGVIDYVINEDLSIDVASGVDLYNKLPGYELLPVKFGIVSGFFNCGNNELTSLIGCPDRIGMGFFVTIIR